MVTIFLPWATWVITHSTVAWSLTALRTRALAWMTAWLRTKPLSSTVFMGFLQRPTGPQQGSLTWVQVPLHPRPAVRTELPKLGADEAKMGVPALRAPFRRSHLNHSFARFT